MSILLLRHRYWKVGSPFVFARGSLVGFVDLLMDSGLVLLGCSLHESNGKRWVNPPSRPQLDAERKPMVRDDGKVLYAPVIEFADAKTRFRWSAQAVRAIDEHNSKEPATAGSMSSEENIMTPQPQSNGRAHGG